MTLILTYIVGQDILHKAVVNEFQRLYKRKNGCKPVIILAE